MSFIDPTIINNMIAALRKVLVSTAKVADTLNSGNNLVISTSTRIEANVHMNQHGRWNVVDIVNGGDCGEVTIDSINRILPGRLLK